MQLTSLAFGGFLLAAFLIYWALPPQKRWGAALAASGIFYALFGVPMLCVLCLCIVASYWGGRWLAAHRSRAALAGAMVCALVPLIFFKYFNDLFPALTGSTFRLFVPIGISFYTFKIIAYLAEVWRGRISPELHFGKYALYVAFFPEITSGPIQRPADLLSQINTPKTFDADAAIHAAQLILWGLFQKMVIADTLSTYVNIGFQSVNLIIGPSIILAAVLYSVQLYCDFAGYSHIAIGCMGLLGYTVPANFKSPYFALSMKDFWGRWHISLSSFLRDYVYFPLGGSRCGKVRHCINLMAVFLVSGIWHGTGLQFLVWGALHGIYQVFGTLTQNLRHTLWRTVHISEQSAFAKLVKMLLTFGLVTAAWVFFGANDLPHALQLFAKMPDSFALNVQMLKNAVTMLTITKLALMRIAVCVSVLAVVDFKSKDCGFTAWFARQNKILQTVFCYAILLAVLFWAPAGGGGFIYFQF